MQVYFHRDFRKRYQKLSLKVRRRVDERLLLFEENPLHPLLNNHPLAGDRRDQWSINITGDWRALYLFIDNDEVIFIDIDTHSNLYT